MLDKPRARTFEPERVEVGLVARQACALNGCFERTRRWVFEAEGSRGRLHIAAMSRLLARTSISMTLFENATTATSSSPHPVGAAAEAALSAWWRSSSETTTAIDTGLPRPRKARGFVVPVWPWLGLALRCRDHRESGPRSALRRMVGTPSPFLKT